MPVRVLTSWKVRWLRPVARHPLTPTDDEDRNGDRSARSGWGRGARPDDAAPGRRPGRTTIRAAVHDGRAGYRSRGSHDVVVPDECDAVDPLAEELLVDGRYPGSAG